MSVIDYASLPFRLPFLFQVRAMTQHGVTHALLMYRLFMSMGGSRPIPASLPKGMGRRVRWVHRPTGLYKRYAENPESGRVYVSRRYRKIVLPFRLPYWLWGEFSTPDVPLFDAPIFVRAIKREVLVQFDYVAFRLDWYPPWKLRMSKAKALAPLRGVTNG